jgi:hypothetical protein
MNLLILKSEGMYVPGRNSAVENVNVFIAMLSFANRMVSTLKRVVSSSNLVLFLSNATEFSWLDPPFSALGYIRVTQTHRRTQQ